MLLPLAPGSVVVIVSSGAAIGGSPLSGGYAGAKRMQWFLAYYLQHESESLNRGIRFVALLPMQISGATKLGHNAAAAYAAQQGISEQAFLDRFGAPLTPESAGRGVAPCSRTRRIAAESRSVSALRGWHRWTKPQRLRDKVQTHITTPPTLARSSKRSCKASVLSCTGIARA